MPNWLLPEFIQDTLPDEAWRDVEPDAAQQILACCANRDIKLDRATPRLAVYLG